jgi:hypothetical protein
VLTPGLLALFAERVVSDASGRRSLTVRLATIAVIGMAASACSHPSSERVDDEARSTGAATEEDEPTRPPPPSCAELEERARATFHSVIDAHSACMFDVDCVAVSTATACTDACPVAIRAQGITELAEATRMATRDLCPAMAEAGCESPRIECARGTPRCERFECVHAEGDAPLRRVHVPPPNEAELAFAPLPPPPLGNADERAKRLLEAIVANDPRLAQDFFFPREAFVLVKAIADADGYWHRLMRRYQEDIAALHGELALPDGATVEYLRLELSRRGGWVRPGEEANALPYHAARHNTLRFLVNGEPRSIEVRVLITWGDRWFVTHLREPR